MSRIIVIVYGVALLLYGGVLIWAAFDIHQRSVYVMSAALPLLILRAAFRSRLNKREVK